MKEQVCFEHHAHDESCFVDRAEAERAHREWTKSHCEAGWPTPGWGAGPATAPKQHEPLTMDPKWLFCPLCGRRIR